MRLRTTSEHADVGLAAASAIWSVELDRKAAKMAREVIERLIDDLDGGKAAETVPFALDGTEYEIDLSLRNAAALRKTLERYITAGRKRTSSRRARPRRAETPPTRSARAKRNFDIVQLREWAGANSVAVPSRGRIPQSVVDQYKAAGGR